jgi:hypothetical protein
MGFNMLFLVFLMVIITSVSTPNLKVNTFVDNDISKFSLAIPNSSQENSSNSKAHLSSIMLGLNGTTNTTALNNATSLVSFVGEVNTPDLARPVFKPFVGINSKESYLTRDFPDYKAAKNQSEKIKPATRVFEIHQPPLSLIRSYVHNKSWAVSLQLSHNKSSLVGFEGLKQNCCIPPDVQLAVGPNYVMEMVNLDGAIFTKNGTLVKAFGLEPFFNPILTDLAESHSMSDPVLLFDSQSGRWFASISDMTIHSIRIAVSKTDDPVGPWRIYNFPFEPQADNCSDQPFIGMSEDKFVVTVNDWSNNCNWYSENQPPEFRGVQFTVTDKSDLVNGVNSVRSMQSKPDLSFFSLHPVVTLSPTSALVIVTVGDFNQNNLQTFYIDGPVYSLHIKIVSNFIQTTHVAPDGIQPITHYSRQLAEEPKVSTGDARVQSASWYHGKLWVTFNDGCFVNGDTQSRPCIRFLQIDTTNNRVIQDFDIAAFGSSLYYPAASIDKSGDLGIIFGYSSNSVHPSLLVSTRFTNGNPTSIEEPEILKLGAANDLSNRYGDYFAASLDPTSTSTIWIAGEYHSTATWSTYVGRLYTE